MLRLLSSILWLKLRKFLSLYPTFTIDKDVKRQLYWLTANGHVYEEFNNDICTAKLIDSNKRLENKVDLLSASMQTVTLDTQLHQAVLADIINIMKDFIPYFIPATLTSGKKEWEKVGIASLQNQKEYIKILCYNVEGWGTCAVEAIDLVYEVQASVCIFTEVGELWNTCRLPHFNTFYQKGTNKNGGVCIAVGKHLKATRIEVNIPNTVIIDITGLSEPVRIIEGTILPGDFNATVKEWNSPITDRRGASYEKSDQAFWTHLSRIYKSRSLPFYKLSDGTKIISTQEGITNELFRYYSEQFKVPAAGCPNEHEGQIDRKYKELVNRLSVLNDSVEKTSTVEITCTIKTLKPKKSAGFDSVSNFIIKILPPSYTECLANCFNTRLNECRYPDDWKIAKIITLNKLKSGIPKCEQTRPISLLATHSKLFGKVLLLRIRHWAETSRSVPPEQFGFRPKCLLSTRVLSIYQEVKNNMAPNIPTLALYVDYQKAYDRVWHAALLCKLEKVSMPLSLLKMTNSWSTDRKAYVEYGEITSKIFSINIGLPPGSSLSPYLFIVSHSDLTNYLGAHSCHLFADDLNNTRLSVMSGTIEEYRPTDAQDPLLSELRQLYIDSFYDCYQFIIPDLNLPEGKQIIPWLGETFDHMQHELFEKQCRTFLVRDKFSTLVGLMTVKQMPNNVVYLAQMAIHPSFKRQGYGSLFMRYLRAMFGPTASYEVLTRRVNKPALEFYAAQGARMIDDERTIAYGYDPKNFLSFQLSGV
ncbi:unnamed protein product [Rotaria magnacalcarata]